MNTIEHVLVVGGTSGMGLELAGRLLASGRRVTVVGRSQDKIDRTLDGLGAAGRIAGVRADVTDEEDVARLFAGVDGLDHIVSTAADIRGAYNLLPDLRMTAARDAIESKLVAPILLAKYGAPTLAERGSITFTSGIAAYRPAARGSVVASVNGALESLAYALAIELGPRRVNVVSPGWVDTPIWQHVAGDATSEVLAAMAKRLPVGRTGVAADIAHAIVFLIENGFTTGSVLHVDGGHRLV